MQINFLNMQVRNKFVANLRYILYIYNTFIYLYKITLLFNINELECTDTYIKCCVLYPILLIVTVNYNYVTVD